MAGDDLGEAAPKSVTAPYAASVVDSADGGTTDASKDTKRPQQEATGESVSIPAAASSANGRTANAAKDTQQPEQREGAKHSSGADGEEMGDADIQQVRCCSDVHNVVLSATIG